METLNHRYSPLEQARHETRVALAGSDRQLSDRDQATLKQILASKCDFVPNALFHDPDAKRKIFDEAPRSAARTPAGITR